MPAQEPAIGPASVQHRLTVIGVPLFWPKARLMGGPGLAFCALRLARAGRRRSRPAGSAPLAWGRIRP